MKYLYFKQDGTLHIKSKIAVPELAAEFPNPIAVHDSYDTMIADGVAEEEGMPIPRREKTRAEIEADIKADFEAGYEGILQLPKRARFGVYLAYVYYFGLFKKIQNTPSSQIKKERIRIPNFGKYGLFVSSYVRHNIGML